VQEPQESHIFTFDTNGYVMFQNKQLPIQ